MTDMLVLGIESSCDDTSVAIVENGKKILALETASQQDLHAIYGGVVPELASRKHTQLIIPMLDRALKNANLTLEQIDLFAVANGPGLMGALMVGVNCAKTLAWIYDKPLIGVNHIHAHLYAPFMTHHEIDIFPTLGVILSGGHTQIMLMHDFTTYEVLGQTRDDAIGEAFDKTAVILGHTYPGGAWIEKQAERGYLKYPFKAGIFKEFPLDISYSGLKTQILNHVQKQSSPLEPQEIADLCASFQQAAFKGILDKVEIAVKMHDPKYVVFGGGVTASKKLKEIVKESSYSNKVLWPDFCLSLDNAGMIAGLGYHVFQKYGASQDLEVYSRS